MIKIENVEIDGWGPAIRGMRNPKNSWDRSDTLYIPQNFCDDEVDYELSEVCGGYAPVVKENDFDLMSRLSAGGPVHAKYRRMIAVYADITAPLYWWKEFDTYKVGTVSNSCSTMHKIADKEFTLEDFSCEHLYTEDNINGMYYSQTAEEEFTSIDVLKVIIEALNYYRKYYLSMKEQNVVEADKTAKELWWQMIQLLPSSYNQRRTEMLNYEVLANIYKWRKNHKLDEWRVHDVSKEHEFRIKDFASGKWGFCDWIESLPYSELITGKEN